VITTLVEKNANFVAENWQKLRLIVIITSTPGQSKQSPLNLVTLFAMVLMNSQFNGLGITATLGGCCVSM
jgi:hypothetical protein